MILTTVVAVLATSGMSQVCDGDWNPNTVPCLVNDGLPCCTVFDACNGPFSNWPSFAYDYSSTGGCDLSCTSAEICSATVALAFYDEYPEPNPVDFAFGPGYNWYIPGVGGTSTEWGLSVSVGDTIGFVNHFGGLSVLITNDNGDVFHETPASSVSLEDCPVCVSTFIADQAGEYSLTVIGTSILLSLEVIPIPSGGCLDIDACNYNPDATWDDNTCVFPGCTDSNSCSFDPEAGCDDGSCQIQPDVNCDGYVNVNDLLGLLGYFGDEDLDGDGVWDSQDECVEDECGVCDGPGPQVLAVDTITFTTDSIFIEAINEWYSFDIPDTLFKHVCVNPGCTNPSADNYNPYASEDDGSCTVSEACFGAESFQFHGYEYPLLTLGNRCWFAENLRSSLYSNGDSIPSNLSDSAWGSTSNGATAIYGEEEGCMNFLPNGDACDPDWSLAEYGRLYNWYAVNDQRGLCPSGWHVPTDLEWIELEVSLGMTELEANSNNYRGTDQGNQLKTTFGWQTIWEPDANGSNSSGFSGLPGGYRESDGYFGFEDETPPAYGVWWSSTLIENNAWYRLLGSSPQILRNQYDLRAGFSVRCVQDSE